MLQYFESKITNLCTFFAFVHISGAGARDQLERQRRDFFLGGSDKSRRPVSDISQLSSTPYNYNSSSNSRGYNSYSYDFGASGDSGVRVSPSASNRRREEAVVGSTTTTVTSREAADRAIATLRCPSPYAPRPYTPPSSPYASNGRMLSTSNRPILSQKTQGGNSTGVVD